MLKAVRAFTYQGASYQAETEISPLAIEADDLAIFLARGVVIDTAPKPVVSKAQALRAAKRSK